MNIYRLQENYKKDIQTILFFPNPNKLFHYDNILTVISLSYYISHMYIPATLYIGVNDPVGQCLYHALSSIYLTNIKIIDVPIMVNNIDDDDDDDFLDTSFPFKFVDGKVSFCKSSSVAPYILIQQYNPDNIRFQIIDQPSLKPHLIIQNNRETFTDVRYFKYKWNNDDNDEEDNNEDSDEDSDEDTGEKKSNTPTTSLTPELKELWQRVDGYTDNIRLNTENEDIFRDFFETLFGISLPLNNLKTYLSEEKINELQINITTHIPQDITNQISTILKTKLEIYKQKTAVLDKTNKALFPKSTVLPILFSDDSSININNTVEIAKLWYSKILTGINYASKTSEWPFSSFGNISPKIPDQPSLIDFIYEQTKTNNHEEQKDAICMSFKQIYITNIVINDHSDEKANATLKKIDIFIKETQKWNENTVKDIIKIIIDTKFTN